MMKSVRFHWAVSLGVDDVSSTSSKKSQAKLIRKTKKRKRRKEKHLEVNGSYELINNYCLGRSKSKIATVLRFDDDGATAWPWEYPQ